MCRKEFGGEDTLGRTSVMEEMIRLLDVQVEQRIVPRAGIQQLVRHHYEQLPLEEFTGEIEERDIQLVSQQAEVSYETAHRYLRYYHGDIVDAIMHLIEYKEDMLIPPFRRRDRGVVQPYERRTIRERLVSSRRKEADSGYESA